MQLEVIPQKLIDLFDESPKKMDFLKEIITLIRQFRSKNNVLPSELIEISIIHKYQKNDWLGYFCNTYDDYLNYYTIIECLSYIYAMAKVSRIEWVNPCDESPADCVVQYCQYYDIFYPNKYLNGNKELVSSKINKVKKEIIELEKLLSDDSFCSKAPSHVIDEKRQRLKLKNDELKSMT